MRIASKYSHMNGEEYLLVHKPKLWEEVQEVINQVDAEICKTKKSKEKTMRGKLLYSPKDMNSAFKQGFEDREWGESRSTFWVTADEKVLRGIHGAPPEEQKKAIEAAGHTPIMSYNQTDFVKERFANLDRVNNVASSRLSCFQETISP